LSVTDAEAERAIAREIAYYRAHLDEGRDDAGLQALRRRCARVLWSELPDGAACAPEDDAIVEALLASLRFTAFEDVTPVLSELRELGLRLVVVSNWDVSLSRVLGDLDLTRWLDGVVTSAAVGARKPRREIFRRGLALAEAEPGQAMHVGDSLEEDVAGAQGAGIEPVLLLRAANVGRGEPATEVTTIGTLRQLLGLLSR
jgi:putative hydrolase of the HAD superfamily